VAVPWFKRLVAACHGMAFYFLATHISGLPFLLILSMLYPLSLFCESEWPCSSQSAYTAQQHCHHVTYLSSRT